MRPHRSLLLTLSITALLAVGCVSTSPTEPPPVDLAPQTTTPDPAPETAAPPTDPEPPDEAAPPTTASPRDERLGAELAQSAPSREVAPPGTAAATLDTFLRLRFPDYDAFSSFEVIAPAGSARFVAAYSTGPAPFPRRHLFGLYLVEDDSIRELATIDVESAELLVSGQARQVVARPSGAPIDTWGPDLWFAVDAGVGAHGSSFELLRWDGDRLTSELQWFSAIPGAAGELLDLNGDAVPEIVLDDTNPFIFCYVCGVQEPGFQLQRWNGVAVVLVELAPFPLEESDESRQALDFVIALVEADLWRDAVTAIEVVERLEPDNDELKWQAILVRRNAEARLREAAQAPDTAYPLLTAVFAGEHAAAVDYLATFDPFDLIDLYGPLTAGTTAEGWETVVAETLIDYADRALAVRPDLAPALFLRGLGRFWLDPAQADLAITDVNAAAALDPEQPLYEAFANLLTP